ncbi:hypothetical protein LguiB_012233 [Lonicera macranthoides]
MCVIASSGESEPQILLRFRETLSNNTLLNNWNEDIDVCRWNGLICSKGSFYGLQLEGMELTGIIAVEILTELPSLRTLSFMNNKFEGPIPNVTKLGALRGLYLSHNRFSGEISSDFFAGMQSMRKVYLANNEFTGKIPSSLADLPKLVELQLQNNEFEGEVPNFEQKDLVANLANNKLVGPIPAVLSDENSVSFLGNPGLCGKPLSPCKSSKKRFPKLAIIIIGAVAVALAVILIASLVLCKKRKSPPTKPPHTKNVVYKSDKRQHFQNYPHQIETYKKVEQGKLYFLRNDREGFELQDLLRASAEVLGSGSFGSSYKAVLLSGQAMVVKRFREMSNVGKEKFYEHMRMLGNLSHPNLLPLVAFYYKKEEKLLVTDFTENGSLASLLHGKSSPNQPGLDWPTRLKIIKRVANALVFLSEELPTLTLSHGHLKSSNVLLNHSYEPLLADYALAPIMNEEHAHRFMVAYKSPEFTQLDRVTKKTDVWCLGILILELLTGKYPENYVKQGKGGNSADLGTWVNSVVREEWTGEVFDKDMRGVRNGAEGEMLKLLKIGMCCCEWNVERRWDLREAYEKIDELKERDSDEDNYSSYTSEGDMYSSRAMTEDDFSFSVTV